MGIIEHMSCKERRPVIMRLIRLIVLTGASGSGKTAIARAIAARHADRVDTLHFDSIGIPSLDRMIAEFGSPEEWQRAKTIEWMANIATMPRLRPNVVFEGQARIAFLNEAIAAADLRDHRIVLVDCDDVTRQRRLTDNRLQPELASATMMNWAAFLRNEARRHHCEIVDTSSASVDACAERIVRHLP